MQVSLTARSKAFQIIKVQELAKILVRYRIPDLYVHIIKVQELAKILVGGRTMIARDD